MEVQSTYKLAKESGAKIIIYGASGSGKTSTLKTAGKVLMISPEKGEMSLNDVKNVDTIRVSTIAETKEAYELAKSIIHKYDTLAVDSISEISSMIQDELESSGEYEGKNAGKFWTDYGKLLAKMGRLFRDIGNTNVIIIALDSSDTKGVVEYLSPLIVGKKAKDRFISFYDTVINIEVKDDGSRVFRCDPTSNISAKNRGGSLEPEIPYTEDVGISDILEKIKGNK